MTDAGGFHPIITSTRRDEREQLLGQIAETLNLPVSVFRHRRPAPEIDGPTATECATMLAAFSRIRDPDARRKCLAMIESCAAA